MFKGITYEKESRAAAGKTVKVKKARISPQQKVAEQFLAIKKEYELKLAQQQESQNPTDAETTTTTNTSTGVTSASTPRERR